MSKKYKKFEEFFKKISQPYITKENNYQQKGEDNPENIKNKITTYFLNTIISEMKEQKISQSDLAKKMGKSRQYIHMVFNNKNNFTLKTISEFCYHLNLNPILLFANTEDFQTCILNNNIPEMNKALNSEKLQETYNLLAKNQIKLSPKEREALQKAGQREEEINE